MPKRLARSFVLAMVTIVLLTGTAWNLTAQDEDEEPAFAQAELFFELNHTDGDLGIHALIDGEPWTELEIEGPGDRPFLQVISRGRLARQGMTEIFFESAEPSFDELRPTDFFSRFPEGRYDIEARAQEGGRMEGAATLSHLLPAPPQNVRLNGVVAAANCDSPLPTVLTPVRITWNAVTQAHPQLGKRGTIDISRYQVFVEAEGLKLSVDLPPSVTEFEVPRAIAAPGGEFKFEIIARATNNNNTAVESCFRTM